LLHLDQLFVTSRFQGTGQYCRSLCSRSQLIGTDITRRIGRFLAGPSNCVFTAHINILGVGLKALGILCGQRPYNANFASPTPHVLAQLVRRRVFNALAPSLRYFSALRLGLDASHIPDRCTWMFQFDTSASVGLEFDVCLLHELPCLLTSDAGLEPFISLSSAPEQRHFWMCSAGRP